MNILDRPSAQDRSDEQYRHPEERRTHPPRSSTGRSAQDKRRNRSRSRDRRVSGSGRSRSPKRQSRWDSAPSTLHPLLGSSASYARATMEDNRPIRGPNCEVEDRQRPRSSSPARDVPVAAQDRSPLAIASSLRLPNPLQLNPARPRRESKSQRRPRPMRLRLIGQRPFPDTVRDAPTDCAVANFRGTVRI